MANEPTPNSTATAPASQDGWTPNPAAVQVAAPSPQQDGWTPNPAAVQVAAPPPQQDGWTPNPATAMTAVEKSNAAVDRMQKEAPPMAANGGFTWEGLKAVPGRFAGGIEQVGKFAGDVVKDIRDPNKPWFVSDEGAAPGSEGESTLYKYGFAPQVEQFNQAQEMARQANEEYRKGHDVAGRRNQLEAWGHWGASVIPVVGPWLGGQAEQAGKTGDFLGTGAETLGQAFGGELLHKGVEIGIDKATRVAGATAEGTALKFGASPDVARTVGNIASLGTKNIAIDAHIDALDKAVNNHIEAKTDYEAKSAAVDAAKTAAAADPGDVNAKANLETAQKALDKSSSAYDKAGDAVDKVQDKILSELSPYDWSKLSPAHIVDIAQSVIGITDDFDTAVTRFANMAGKQAGQAFKSALSSVREDLKAIINGDVEGKIVDPKTAADAIDEHTYQNIESPLQQASGETRGSNNPVVENFRSRVEARIDKFFQDNPGEAGSIDQEQKIKQQILDRVMRGQDLGDGVTAPREPNLYEAESIRRGLKQYEPNETKGYNKVAYDIANFMREVIDEGYSKRGVDEVKEARAKEAKLITISEGLRKAQPLFETQESTPTLRKVIKASGAVLLASTLGAALLHNPLGALTGLGELWGKMYDSNAKDIAGNLDRARELAGREPNAKAVTPQFGEAQPVPPEPAPAIPNMPPPPKAPEAAVRPAVNHDMKAAVQTYFHDDPLDPNAPSYQDRLAHFSQEFRAIRQEVADAKAAKRPLTPAQEEEWQRVNEINNAIIKARAAEDKVLQNENDKRQAAYQKEVDKYNAKYTVEQRKATEKMQKEAQAAAEKAAQEKEASKAEGQAAAAEKAQDLTAHIANPFTPGEEMPISERWKSLVEGISGPRIRAHELGHHIMAALANWLTGDVIGENHPKLSGGKNSLAEARWDDHPFYDEKGNLDLGKVTDNLDQLLDLFHGGAIAEEIVHGVPMAENYGATGDLSKMRGLLKDGLKMQPAEIGAAMKASELRVRKVMSTPGVRDIIDRYTRSREAGLRDDVHMSDETVAKAVEEVKNLLGGGENGTNNEGKAANGLRGGAEKGEAGRVGGNASKSEGEAGAAREKGASAGSARRGTERVGGVTEKTKANIAAEPEMKVEHRDNAMGGDVRLEGPEGNHGYVAYTHDGKDAEIRVSMIEKGERGKGYGQKAYETIADKVRAKGGERLHSDPEETSPDAARVWEKLSAKHPGEITKDADGRYTWDLKKGGETKANIAPGDVVFPKEQTTPITEKLVDKYGTTDEPLTTGFILSDGRRVPIGAEDHAMAVHSSIPKEERGPNQNENLKDYINNEKAIRTRYRASRRGEEVVFSVPTSGVSESQMEQMRRDVGKMRNGNAVMEIAEGEGKSTTKEFVRPSDIEPMLREIGAHPEDNALKANLGHEAMAGMKATREAEGVANKENENQKGIRETARAYNAERGRPDVNPAPVKEDPRVRQMGEEYEKLVHSPNDPKVKASYDAFKKELDQQYDALTKSGFKFDTSKEDPYPSYEAMRKDILQNKHLTAWEGAAPPADHPLAERDPKTGMTYNEKFRLVHDVLGHAAHDADFSGNGEESAWNYHRQMFSPEAQNALAGETRGQVARYTRYGGFPETQKAVSMPEHYTVRPEDLNKGEWAKQVEEKPWGGVNPNNPEAPSKTYGFEIAPEHRHTPGTLTADEARAYAERPEVKELLASHPDIKMGWDKTTGGRPELNIGASTDDLATAKKMARLLDQRVFVNTKTGEEIPAGGKGERTSFPEYPMEQRLNDLKANIAAAPAIEGLDPNKHEVIEPGKTGAEDLGLRSGFLLKDGSMLFSKNEKLSHDGVRAEVGVDKMRNANAIRMEAGGNGVELESRPTEQQLSEIGRIFKDSGHRNIVWDFRKPNGTIIQAKSAPFGEFRRAVNAAYPETNEALKANIKAEPKEEEGFNFGKNAEGTPDQQKGLISTALPKGKKAIADPLETDVRVGMESLTPKSEAAIADKIREMPGFRIPDAIKDPKKVIAKYIDQFKKNLIDVHNRVDPETRAATAKWYESANGIAQRTAEKFGKTLKQGAGILATLSPQKDWDQNVSLAERVNDIYHTKGDMRMTPEMRAKVDQLVGEKHTDEEGNVTRKNDKLGNLVDSIGDRSFNELSNPLEKAAFIRLYDEAHNSREFHRIDPGTGNRAEIVTTDSGAPRRIAWGSLNEISKAVSILEDGSRENISNNLGGSHKVRNFYNNILDPNNPAGHVTVDTHAVAAGHQRMLGGKSPEVKANFGGISAAETGLKGMYAVNAEAYRQAAKELGIQPRQLQSIVWEEIRKQFPDEYKRSTTAQAAIDGIWKEYEDGDITLKNAQQRVRDYAKKGYAEMVANKPAAKAAAKPHTNWDWEKIGLLPSNFVKSGK